MTGDRAEHSCSKHVEEKKIKLNHNKPNQTLGFWWEEKSRVRGRKSISELFWFLLLPHTSRFFVARQKSDKSATKSGLVGRYLTVLDLKTSCQALSPSVRWAKTICRGSRVPQPMRDCHERGHLDLDGSVPSLNAVSHDKNSASVRQADVPTNLSPTKSLQLCDKKSASVRRPLKEKKKKNKKKKNSHTVSRPIGIYWTPLPVLLEDPTSAIIQTYEQTR